MDKKGSQVGMILSFVIFMTFIFFIFIITQPALDSREDNNSPEFLTRNLIEKTSENLTTASVSVTSNEDCVELTSFSTLTGIGDKIIVVDDNGNLLSSSVSGNNLFVDKGNVLFLKVYESSEFQQQTGTISGCDSLTEGSGYNIGFLKTSENLFESKIVDLINDYSIDYDDLKDELRVLASNEFAFSFKYKNGTEVQTTAQGHQVPSGANVFATNTPVVYVNDESGIEICSLNVKVW